MNFPRYPLGYSISYPKVQSIGVIHGKIDGLFTMFGFLTPPQGCHMSKKNKRIKKNKKKKPQMALIKNPFGHFSKKKHEDLLKIFACKHGLLCEQIDNHIAEAAIIVSKFYPLEILQRAYVECTAKSIGKISEVEFTSEDALSRRMLDYGQCLIVSVCPSDEGYGHLTDEAWNKLKEHIEGIYNNLLPYFISSSAQRKTTKKIEDEHEEFYTKAQMYWSMVRGEKHINHMTTHLEVLLIPHNDIFTNLFGITVSDFIYELKKIRDALTKGILDSASECQKLHKEFFEKLGTIEDLDIPGGVDIKDFFNKKMTELGFKEDFQKAAGKFFGLDLFDLSKVTNLPRILLEELSWSPGKSPEFISVGELKGWPLNLLPTWNRPFLKIENEFYCFDLYVLSDKIYRSIQKLIFRIKPEYKTTWNERQKQISEQIPFDLFKKLLPHAETYQSIYYRWKTGKDRRLNWLECDGLIIYDDSLFILEIKAGAFTYTPPATDFPAYINSIKELILKPAEQGHRFKEYLLSNDSVAIFDQDHNRLTSIAHNQFRNITICCVTLDQLTELAAQSNNIKTLGGGIQGHNNWTIGIDDLLVYTDFFKNPLQFLHFMEQRNKAYSSSLINPEDELDHLGLYLRHNCYVQYAEEMTEKKGVTRIFWHGYREEIDKYYSNLLTQKNVVVPTQKIPKLLEDIIKILAQKSDYGRAFASSKLLNMSSEARDEYVNSVNEIIDNTTKRERPLPFSLVGIVDITTLCHIAGINFSSLFDIKEHVYATMIIAGESNRMLIELFFSSERKLENVKVSLINIENLEDENRDRVETLAQKISHDRLIKALKIQKKISRNQFCPCGSGKKFKKCCINKI